MEKSFFINNVILALLFIGNMAFEDYNYYFKLIYFFLTIYHLYVLLFLFCVNQEKKYLKIQKYFCSSLFLYLFTYFIICDTNPLFYLLVYYIFFPNFFKAIIIVLIHSFFLSKYFQEERQNIQSFQNNEKSPLKNNIEYSNNSSKSLNSFKNKRFYFLCDYINYFTYSKLRFFIFLLSLILIIFIEILIFFNRIKIWVFFNDKRQTLPIASSKNTTFYITAMVVNMEDIINNYLIEMSKLINYLGEENVIVSIVENGDSTDNTRDYLVNFQKYLNSRNITNKFLLEHEIEDPRIGQFLFEEVNPDYLRIKFYATLRNKCFDLLYDLHIDFSNTKIIYFNDIIFEYENIINLLSTNNEDYDAVCGLDFYDVFYDSWVSIDLSGYSLLHEFPYFSNKEAQDLFINHRPIRVFSCWNGVIVFNAAPLKDKKIEFRYESDPDREPKHRLYSDQQYNFESECTYFHIDLHSLGYTKKFINPEVRVAYLYNFYNMKKNLYPNKIDIKNYFRLYLESLFKRRNKEMSNYKDSYIKLNTVLEDWYYENRKKENFIK